MTYLVRDPHALVSVVGMDQLSGAFPLSAHPRPHILGTGVLVGVHALAVPQMTLPLPLVNVAVRVRVGAKPVSLVVHPASCKFFYMR